MSNRHETTPEPAVPKPDGAQYAEALREMTHRYERLVRQLSILREADSYDDFSLDLGQIFQALVETLAFSL
ncbi:MAG: hypothetical protein NTW86_11320, partial [Candidatus Sumerlaeota bacterium]|nr:hypothetical protein [Candidatus Sumerlaeota bacterium]